MHVATDLPRVAAERGGYRVDSQAEFEAELVDAATSCIEPSLDDAALDLEVGNGRDLVLRDRALAQDLGFEEGWTPFLPLPPACE